MVPAILAVDIDGEPLRRAILQNDARATVEIDEVRTTLGDFELLARTGSVLTSSPLPPRRSGSRDTKPRCGERLPLCRVPTTGWLAPSARCRTSSTTGRSRVDSTISTAVPLDAVQSATPVTWPKMLDVARPGEVVGELSAFGLRGDGPAAGTTIVVGGADHVLSAYGAGLVNQGDCLIKLGGSGDILAVSDKKFLDSRLYLDCYPILASGCPTDAWPPAARCCDGSKSLRRGVAGRIGRRAGAAANRGRS